MLENFEKRLIKKLYILSILSKPSLIMTFVTLVIWFVLVFIDDFIFQNQGFFDLGLYTMLGIVALYLFIYCYSTLRVRFAISSGKWKDIINKLSVNQDSYMYTQEVAQVNGISSLGNLTGNSAIKTEGAIQTMEVAGMIATKMTKNIRQVMDICQIKIEVKKYILALIFIPIIVLVGVYVPSINNSEQAMKERIAIVNNAMENLNKEFEKYGYRGIIHDIKRENSYYTFIAIRDSENDIEENTANDIFSYYVAIDLKNDGSIIGINYSFDVAKNSNKEENISKLCDKVKEINDILKNSKMGSSAYNLFVDENFVRDMAAEYLESNGNVDIYESVKNEKVRATFSYYIEDYNSDEPYIYFTVREP